MRGRGRQGRRRAGGGGDCNGGGATRAASVFTAMAGLTEKEWVRTAVGEGLGA